MNSKKTTQNSLKKSISIDGNIVYMIPENNAFNYYIITKYICALLNSKGGNVIIGSDSNKNIKGVKLTRENKDIFQRNLDECLKHFNPSVKGHEYTVNFKPVKLEDTKKIAVQDLYIIEIIIQGSNNLEDLYFTQYDECWIKKNDAEIEILPISDLKDYMEKHLNEGFEVKKEQLQKQIDLFEGKGLETLSADELKKLKNQITLTLNSIQKVKTANH